MAFGDLKGTLSGSATSVGTLLNISTGGPITVAVGDLIYAVIAEQGSITSTACQDNLGHNYTPLTGADAGTTVTGRAWWTRVTTATSPLTSISFTTSGGTSNAVGLAAVVEGPLLGVPKEAFEPSGTGAVNLHFDWGNRLVTTMANLGIAVGTIFRSVNRSTSNKLYCEFTLVHGTAQDSIAFGVVNSSFTYTSGTTFLGVTGNNSIGWGFADGAGQVWRNQAVVATIQSFTQGDTVCMAVDLENHRIWYRTNGGNWNNSAAANPATNSFGIDISLLGATLYPAIEQDAPGSIISANFGQNAYAQSVPSGFGNWDIPLDWNQPNVLNDNTTPFTGPPIGTVFEQEIVMCWAAHTGNVTLTATSPNTKAVQLNTATILTAAIGRQVVAASSSATPAWTSSGTPTESAYGTSSFKRELTQSATLSLISPNDQIFAPAIAYPAVSYSSASPLYRYRIIPGSEVIRPAFIQVSAAVGTTFPAKLSDSDSFFAPALAGGFVTVSYAAASPQYRYRRIPDSAVISTLIPIPFAGLTPARISDADSFSVPSLAATYNLSPAVLQDNDAFSAPAVGAGTGLLPTLFVDSDTFSAPVIAFANDIQPSLLSDTDTFYSVTVTFGTLQLSTFADSDSFFAPATGAAAQITPSLIVDGDAFLNMSFGAFDLVASLFVDTITFYSPAISATASVTPSLFTDSDLLRVPALTTSLRPSLFVDSDAFSAPTLTGTGELSPQKFTEADGFFAPTAFVPLLPLTAHSVATPLYRYRYVRQAEVITPVTPLNRFVGPGLIAGEYEKDYFFYPTVVGGEVSYRGTISETSPLVLRSSFIPPMSVSVVIATPQSLDINLSKITDTDSFLSPVVTYTYNLTNTSVLADTDAFFTPIRIDLTVSAGRITDTDVFNTAIVARGVVDISPTPLLDVDSLFIPGVSIAASQSIVANLFTSADVLYVPAIGAGTVNLTPALFTDSDILFNPTTTLNVSPSVFTDADSLFTLVFGLAISPSLFTDTDNFYIPAISVSAVNVSPALFTDTDAAFAPNISSSPAQGIVPARLTDADVLYDPLLTVGAANITPARFTDTDTLFAPVVPANATVNLFSDADSLFVPTLGIFLSPTVFVDSDAFFIPSVSTRISPALFVDADSFFMPTTFVAVPSGLGPIMFVDNDIIFSPSISPPIVNITPNLIRDLLPFFSQDDIFFDPQFRYDQVIATILFADGDILYPPSFIGGSRGPEEVTVVDRTLSADYGIRKSRLRRGRLIIGRH